MTHRHPRQLGLTLFTMLTLLATVPAQSARADSGSMTPLSVLPAYAQECAACHTPYPPGMLPAASWQRVMNGLSKHYGTDASLDAASFAPLNTWLQAHAATLKRVKEAPPEDRITRTAWFERKHRKLDAAVWKLPSVKSAAQCGACHTDADRGNFDDDRLRLPEGLDARMGRAWRN